MPNDKTYSNERTKGAIETLRELLNVSPLDPDKCKSAFDFLGEAIPENMKTPIVGAVPSITQARASIPHHKKRVEEALDELSKYSKVFSGANASPNGDLQVDGARQDAVAALNDLEAAIRAIRDQGIKHF